MDASANNNICSGASSLLNSQTLRSFNLHRLRTIEAQRYEAATTFDAAEAAIGEFQNCADTTPLADSGSSVQLDEKQIQFLNSPRSHRILESTGPSMIIPSRIDLKLDDHGDFLDDQLFKEQPHHKGFYYDYDGSDEADERDWSAYLSVVELNLHKENTAMIKTGKPARGSATSVTRPLRKHYRRSSSALIRKGSMDPSTALSIRGLNFVKPPKVNSKYHSDATLMDDLEEEGVTGSYGSEAYADPRYSTSYEMKKRQQEIVVSGLPINTTSDISSEDEDNGTTNDSSSSYQFLLQKAAASRTSSSRMMPADPSNILMSLVEPSVRKIGGGGAVSTSAFQVCISLTA